MWPLYRCLFLIALTFLFSGFVIKVMRDHSINWVYIFDIQQKNKMSEFNFYKIYLII